MQINKPTDSDSTTDNVTANGPATEGHPQDEQALMENDTTAMQQNGAMGDGHDSSQVWNMTGQQGQAMNGFDPTQGFNGVNWNGGFNPMMAMPNMNGMQNGNWNSYQGMMGSNMMGKSFPLHSTVACS
jgi:hypothetical protein